MAQAQKTYNERLFSGGVRRRLHMARFHWLHDTVAGLGLHPQKVIELGCYDGRAVGFLPDVPQSYTGFDAGWENSLALARSRWASRPDFRFVECRDPAQMDVAPESADMAMALETLEHIPANLIDRYIEKIAASLKPGGYFLVSVPNEKGPVFAVKHLAKKLLVGSPEPYTLREYFYQSLGLTHKVAWDDHKGFDYAHMIARLRAHFDIVSVHGLPIAQLPPLLNFGVGIVCRKKARGGASS